MTTKTAGGRITGLLALSMEAQDAFEVGDAVIVTGDYEVDVPDGSSPILGHVSVANKTPTHGVATRAPEVPGPVTVEAIGFYVRKCVAGGTIAAGAAVGYDNAGVLKAAGSGVVTCGLALMGGALNDEIDVLFR
jgi:hypothetical protein